MILPPDTRINLIGSPTDETLKELPPRLPGTVIWVITDDAYKPVRSWVSYTSNPRGSIKWFFESHSEVTDYWLGITPSLFNGAEIMHKFKDNFPNTPMRSWYSTSEDYPEIVKFLNSVPWELTETPLETELRKMLEGAEQINTLPQWKANSR